MSKSIRFSSRAILLSAIALTGLSAAGGAALAQETAGGWELGIGITDELDGERTDVATVSWLSSNRHPWEFTLGWIDQRDMNGRLFVEDTLWGSVNRRFYLSNWFVSLGVAVAQEDNDVLSDHFQFHTGAGYRFGRFSLSLRHLSNASISGRNRGDTFLQLHFHF